MAFIFVLKEVKSILVENQTSLDVFLIKSQPALDCKRHCVNCTNIHLPAVIDHFKRELTESFLTFINQNLSIRLTVYLVSITLVLLSHSHMHFTISSQSLLSLSYFCFTFIDIIIKRSNLEKKTPVR